MIRSRRLYIAKFIGLVILTFAYLLDFLKVVRLVFWSGVVGPGTNDVELSLARASRSQSRYALKSSTCEQVYILI